MKIKLAFTSLIFVCYINLYAQKNKTRYIFVVVVDGPRYSETWGDSTKQYIPNLFKLSKEGTVSDSFYNNRYTYTSAGHTAITTGHYQQLENRKGTQLPDYPSFLQYYLKKTKVDSTKAWVITSKDKLAILGNTQDKDWNNKFLPSLNCGIAGLGSGYRNDSTTFVNVINVLDKYQPHVVVVNFREPDWSGHAKDWQGYIKGIKDTDSLVYRLWQYLQSNEFYKGNTALFVTNDHGRHIDGWKDGFAEHGDLCEGCKHINLYAFGPDFKKNCLLTTYYTQTDLTATIAKMLKLKMPHGEGKVMKEIFD